MVLTLAWLAASCVPDFDLEGLDFSVDTVDENGCPTGGILRPAPFTAEGREVATQRFGWTVHPRWAVSDRHRLRSELGWSLEGALTLEPADECHGPYQEFSVMEGNTLFSWVHTDGTRVERTVEGASAETLSLGPSDRIEDGRLHLRVADFVFLPLEARDADGEPLTLPSLDVEGGDDILVAADRVVAALAPGETLLTYRLGELSLTVEVVVVATEEED